MVTTRNASKNTTATWVLDTIKRLKLKQLKEIRKLKKEQDEYHRSAIELVSYLGSTLGKLRNDMVDEKKERDVIYEKAIQLAKENSELRKCNKFLLDQIKFHSIELPETIDLTTSDEETEEEDNPREEITCPKCDKPFHEHHVEMTLTS